MITQHTVKSYQQMVDGPADLTEKMPQRGILMLEDGTTFEGIRSVIRMKPPEKWSLAREWWAIQRR